jgi:hypothetical protein
MVNESRAFARVLEHFPMTGKTRAGAAIETHPADDAPETR